MSHIAINFDEVPDTVQPVAPGIYVCLVSEAALEPTKDGKGEKVVAQLKVDDQTSPENGRVIFDHISTKMTTRLKRLCKSAGLSVGHGGLNVDELVGKHVRVRVKNRIYADPTSGERRETSSVDDYLFEA